MVVGAVALVGALAAGLPVVGAAYFATGGLVRLDSSALVGGGGCEMVIGGKVVLMRVRSERPRGTKDVEALVLMRSWVSFGSFPLMSIPARK